MRKPSKLYIETIVAKSSCRTSDIDVLTQDNTEESHVFRAPRTSFGGNSITWQPPGDVESSLTLVINPSSPEFRKIENIKMITKFYASPEYYITHADNCIEMIGNCDSFILAVELNNNL